MLLIHPPVAKPTEPPAGIARLSGTLSANNIPHHIVDANIEGLLFLLQQPHPGSDTWTRRALKHCSDNIAALKDIRTYQSFDRYSRAIRDLNRVLAISSKEHGVTVGLADYQDQQLSPIRSSDLMKAAEHPEQNLFYPYFKERLPEVIEKAFSPRRHQGHEEKHKGIVTEEKEQIPVIGFSLNYLSQALCTFAMIGFIKKELPNAKIVLGGGLVTSWMNRPGWKNPFGGLVDHLVSGPGEQPLLGLLGNTAIKQPHAPPNYDALPLHAYLSPGFILPYSASSGCYWNRCSFCPEKAEKNSYTTIPAQLAMNELCTLIDKTRPVLLHLLDNAINPALLRALADKPLGIPWYGFARFNKELLDMDYCMQLRRSGCVMLKLGLESGDQEVLDKLRKGIDLETASAILKNLHKAGIATYIYLLFGTPAETPTEARRTLDFVVRHRETINFLNLAIFNMPVCGSDAEDHETEHFYEGDLSLYTGFRHPQGWDRKLVRQFLEREFKKHPAVSAILKNDPPVFTSNHAAFFAR